MQVELLKLLNKKLLGPNGYVKLPGGLILQWGTIETSTVEKTITFPIPFPTAVVAAIPQLRDQASGTSPTSIYASSPILTGFTLILRGYTPPDPVFLTYFAIGY